MDNRRIFQFLDIALRAGRGAVLVTVISVDGSSMRDPGAHMAVSADGNFVGSLSGGCIENAVVAEALTALEDGKPRITRYGSGSPYLDIRLPCGGGLDVHFLPVLEPAMISDCVNHIEARQPFSLFLPLETGAAKMVPEWRETGIELAKKIITIGHWPAPKLTIIGHGAGVTSLSKLGQTLDMDIDVLSSDQHICGLLANLNIKAKLLKTPQDIGAVQGDPWTAFVFMFHDHDWEGDLMVAALNQPHFHIGAMGGRMAHAKRIKLLRSLNVSEEALIKINAPIGLFHSARDPETMAVSTIAEVIKSYHEMDFQALHKPHDVAMIDN